MRTATHTANSNTNLNIACPPPAVAFFDESSPGTPGTPYPLDIAYDELRRLARAKTARFKESLNPTELVHETFLRLAANHQTHFEGRRHLFFTVDRAMRDILVEKARQRTSLKRGFGTVKVELDDAQVGVAAPRDQQLDLDHALAKLGRVRPAHAQVVRMSFFDGLTHPEIGKKLGVSRATVERYWASARTWLRRELSGDRA